jgi:hypothetical protein
MSPNVGGWGDGVAGFSVYEYSCAHGAQINFGDLTPYLIYSQVGLELPISSSLKYIFDKSVQYIHIFLILKLFFHD